MGFFPFLGGDEWKQLVSHLGMPMEKIRFLDKRAFNPAATVLECMATMTDMTTGQLYDILKYCGLEGYSEKLWPWLTRLVLQKGSLALWASLQWQTIPLDSSGRMRTQGDCDLDRGPRLVQIVTSLVPSCVMLQHISRLDTRWNNMDGVDETPYSCSAKNGWHYYWDEPDKQVQSLEVLPTHRK